MQRLVLLLALATIPMQNWNVPLNWESILSEGDESLALSATFDMPIGVADSRSQQIQKFFDRWLSGYCPKYRDLVSLAEYPIQESLDLDSPDTSRSLYQQRVRWQI